MGGCRKPTRKAFGHISRVGEEFVLKAIRDAGSEPEPLMSETYRLIPWGEHLYFCSTAQDKIFFVCLAGVRRMDQQHLRYWANQRSTDDEKLQPGFPRVPLKFWLRFAIDEVNPWTEGGALNKAIRSLIARISPNEPPLP